MPAVLAPQPFAGLLREWRLARRLTQQVLAEEAEISTRHLSFLETGRARPSREMVLILASVLELPLRDRNGLLHAAGFAPVYAETPLDAAPMEHVRKALDRILAQQEPYPAIVLDRGWNLLRANAGATRLFARLLADRPQALARLGNVAHAVFDPDGLRPAIVNWDTTAAALAERLHREAAADPSPDGARALREAVLAYPGVPAKLRVPSFVEAPPIAIAVHVRAPDGGEARLFTMLTSLGTPLDVTADELRIELYFPSDDASEAFLREG